MVRPVQISSEPVLASPSVSPNPQSPVLPKKASKLSLILLVILVVGIFGAVAFWLGKSSKKPKIVAQPTPTLVPETNPTSDPTADWMTFANTDYDFSLKYPSDLVNLRHREASPDFEFCFDQDFIECPVYIGILDITYESEVAELEKEWQLMKENPQRIKSFDTLEDFELLGKKGKRISGYAVTSGREYYSVFFPKGGKTYNLSFDMEPTAKKKGYSETTFNQILSTFKFD